MIIIIAILLFLILFAIAPDMVFFLGYVAFWAAIIGVGIFAIVVFIASVQ